MKGELIPAPSNVVLTLDQVETRELQGAIHLLLTQHNSFDGTLTNTQAAIFGNLTVTIESVMD